MILRGIARFRYFFRPFRRGAYQHAPSIEELYVMRQGMREDWSSGISRIARWLIRRVAKTARR